MTGSMAARLGVLSVVIVTSAALTGCGSAKISSPQPSGSSSRPGVDQTCANATLAIPKGRQLDFTSCGGDAVATVTDPSGVLNKLGNLVFIARASGQATIDIARGVPCTPGQVCSQVLTPLARILVNVS